MKCQRCGVEIEDKKLYCTKCGEAVDIVPEYNFLEEELLSEIIGDKKPEDNDFVEGVYFKDTTTPVDESVDDKKTLEVETKKSKGSSFALILIGVAIGIIVVASIGFWVLAEFEKANYANSYENFYKIAEEAFEKEEYQTAIDNYLLAIGKEPNDIDALLKLGTSYYNLGDFEKAIEYYNRVISIDPNNTKAYEALIGIYIDNKDYQTLTELANNPPIVEIESMLSDYIVEQPTFSIDEGTYADDLKLVLQSDSNYPILYTIDGSDPTANGQIYSKSIEISVGETIVKACCVNEKGIYSEVAMNSYIVKYDVPASALVEPAGGTYYGYTTVTITYPQDYYCYYTWDGSTPTTSSPMYNGPIEIPAGSNTLNVLVMDNHGMQSAIESYDYVMYVE